MLAIIGGRLTHLSTLSVAHREVARMPMGRLVGAAVRPDCPPRRRVPCPAMATRFRRTALVTGRPTCGRSGIGARPQFWPSPRGRSPAAVCARRPRAAASAHRLYARSRIDLLRRWRSARRARGLHASLRPHCVRSGLTRSTRPPLPSSMAGVYGAVSGPRWNRRRDRPDGARRRNAGRDDGDARKWCSRARAQPALCRHRGGGQPRRRDAAIPGVEWMASRKRLEAAMVKVRALRTTSRR